MRNAVDVARRCLSLELLAQRTVLETEAGDGQAKEAENARAQWAARIEDLGVTLSEDESALFNRTAGNLTEDERDDLDGRATGAAVLLWALGRAEAKPTFAAIEEIVGEHGLLNDGSIAKARELAEAATLRPEEELESAQDAYAKKRGKAEDPTDAEQIYAGIAAHHLAWVLDETMSFEGD
jgi:hypothetical protein